MSHDQDEGWGWEQFGSEDDTGDSFPSDHVKVEDGSENRVERSPARQSDKSQQLKRSSSQSTNSGMGITSSPSFQELERAIGATLASNLSNGDLSDGGTESKPQSPAGLPSRLSSTNLTQKKIQHQRTRQNQYQQQSLPRNLNHANYKYANIQSNQVLSYAKSELSAFINEEESRALVIFHLPVVPSTVISEACSKFGVLYYIRPEFHQKGVTFISYFDLQSATNAKANMPSLIGSDNDCTVHYSIMLHATNSNSEESRLVIKNLPENKGEKDVQDIVSRYGPLRSIQKIFGSGEVSIHGNPTTYTIEYFNIQDARLAASELSATSSTIWGPNIVVKFAPLDERKQQLCKQLLSTLSKWRSEMAVSQQNVHAVLAMPPTPSPVYPYTSQHHHNFGFAPSIPQTPIYGMQPESTLPHWNNMFVGSPMIGIPQQLQSIPSPDLHVQPGMGFFMHPNDSTFIPSVPSYYFPGPELEATRMLKGMNMGSQEKTTDYSPTSGDFYQNNHDNRISNLKRSKVQTKDISRPLDMEFALDVQRILDGQEKRTTIMVRNIPNKYTQQMLLEEVNAAFQGTYDFFYLPIDFKNHCNVGYGFINFVDPKFIPRFVEQFHGQKWKNFNSEKVCAVSFARIQGKSAMISRFQNSSLLEKDAEYKPLLFYSNGPNRGQPEPFPTTSRGLRNSSSDEENGNI